MILVFISYKFVLIKRNLCQIFAKISQFVENQIPRKIILEFLLKSDVIRKNIVIFVRLMNHRQHMKRYLLACALGLISMCTYAAVNAQHSFEGTVPTFVRVNGRGAAAISADKYKDGQTSLQFSWNGPVQLMFTNYADMQNAMKADGGGMILWIYNTEAFNDSLLFRFHNKTGGVMCQFRFNMDFTGWRAIWIKYEDMFLSDGATLVSSIPLAQRDTEVSRMTVTVPSSATEGKIYIDRLSFQTARMNDQIVPDKQIPDNNLTLRSRQWQWGRLWEWEQYPMPEVKPLTDAQKRMLADVEARMDEWAATGNPGSQYTQNTLMTRANNSYAKYKIGRLPDGTVTGAPLLSDDEFNNSLGEMRIRYIQEIVYWYALDYLYTGNTSNVERVINAMDHAIDQGFAYGSGWGLNRHYGYQVRDLYKGIWIFRKELAKAGKLEEYTKVLLYWSAIQEARKPYAEHRDEILDTWNTLLNSKVIAAMLIKDEAKRYAHMKMLGEWVSASMLCSDGTLGGIKPDGTSFHHGGHYPGYSIGAFAAVGDWCWFTKDTDFAPAEDGRQAFKKSLMAMQNYSHTREWGIAVCGRHPLDGTIPDKDVTAFARLAMLGDLTGNGKAADPELAGAYIALGGSDKNILATFKKMGIAEYAPQNGFTVYNYGAFGIHRRDGWMLSLKGYNSDVWASEIYAKENRYGRYLSYGTAQVFARPSAKESGYVREGWDWNRFPGGTAIHLPYELLDSPLPGTLMERNDSRFPGVSSLEGMNGCLAFTYVEKDRKNFCAGATATKSVFCFDNRIIHIGTGISNNSQYSTETTLYQLALADRTEEVDINDIYSGAFPYSYTVMDHEQVVLTDTKGNFYIIKDGYGLTVEKKSQTSPSDERKDDATGDFITAYINHGTAPSNASYEYMLLVKPSTKDVKAATKKAPYTVLNADNYAHVVKDAATGITAYIIYKVYNSGATLLNTADAETIVMERTKEDGTIVMSVCTPDLGITQKGYTTAQTSQPLVKKVTLNGIYKLKDQNNNVRLTVDGQNTVIEATCLHGQPVEFILTK